MRMFLAAMLFCGSLFGKTVELNQDNMVLLRNEINDSSITKVQLDLAKKVAKRGAKTYTIYLVLDSPGGSIDSGLNFIEFAKSVPNLETITIFAASMASAIVEALPGNRNALETGILMFHRAAGGVSGQFEDGELESRLAFYKKLVRNMEQTNADRMNITLETYKAKVKDEYWISGKDALKEKVIDDIVTVKCSDSLLNSSVVESFLFMGMFQIDVKFNGCPLVKLGQVVDPKMKAKYVEYKNSLNWSILK